MKSLLLVLAVMLVGCGATPIMKDVVGTYEAKVFGKNARIMLLENGVVEQYTNDEKKEVECKWKIVGWEIHAEDEGMITVFRINKDGSITYIAGLDNDGKREDYPNSSQHTFKKPPNAPD